MNQLPLESVVAVYVCASDASETVTETPAASAAPSARPVPLAAMVQPIVKRILLPGHGYIRKVGNRQTQVEYTISRLNSSGLCHPCVAARACGAASASGIHRTTYSTVAHARGPGI